MPTYPTFEYEKSYWRSGFELVAGIDEVGRGSWAGPVVAAAVVLHPKFNLPGLNDSKKLNATTREKFAEIIQKEALFFGIAQIEVGVINRQGIGKASFMAMRSAVKKLKERPHFILVDAFYVPYLIDKKLQIGIVRGDQLSISIAAASVVAKVYRDKLMEKLSKSYPKYGFERHKGYGTADHQSAIKKFGFTPIHRTSFNITIN